MAKSVKTALVILCAVCLVAVLVVPVNAAVMPVGYDPADFISDVIVSGDNKTVVYDFSKAHPGRFRFTDNLGGSLELPGDPMPVHYIVNPESKINHVWWYPFGLRYSEGQNLVSSHGFIDVSEIMAGATFTFTSSWNFEVDMQSWDTNDCEIGMALYYHAYDAEGKYLETVKTDTSWSDMEVDDTGDYYVMRSVFRSDFAIEVKPNVHFICPYITATILTSTAMLGDSEITVWDASFGGSVDINMIYENSNQMGAVNDKLADINDKLDELLKQPENEKNEIDQAGDDALKEMVDIMPDHSEGLINAFSGLASSMAYNGTEAKLDIPDVSMPGIDGLFDGFVIMENQSIDFETYFDMMPDNLLLLIQSLFTAALIVFCFKELYNTIEYCLTLKGGK